MSSCADISRRTGRERRTIRSFQTYPVMKLSYSSASQRRNQPQQNVFHLISRFSTDCTSVKVHEWKVSQVFCVSYNTAICKWSLLARNQIISPVSFLLSHLNCFPIEKKRLVCCPPYSLIIMTLYLIKFRNKTLLSHYSNHLSHLFYHLWLTDSNTCALS